MSVLANFLLFIIQIAIAVANTAFPSFFQVSHVYTFDLFDASVCIECLLSFASQ